MSRRETPHWHSFLVGMMFASPAQRDEQ